MSKFLTIIVLIRILLIYLPSFHIDISSFQAWSGRLVEVGPTQFYSPGYFADYFPGYLYILWFLGETYQLIFPTGSIFSLGFEYYLKIITNLFDFAAAYYIYKIVSRYQKKISKLAPIFYLSNPALILNSSIWGQVDGILAFFLIFSCYNLMELKKPFKFSFFSALSLLVKPQGLSIFPITILYFLKNFHFKKYLYLFMIPLFLILFSLPFFLKDPILGLFHLFQKSASTYPYTSMFSYNFWAYAGWWVPDATKFLNVPYQIWGISIYLLSLIFILFPLFRKENLKNNLLIYFASSLSIFAFFLFLTRIHQRYLFHFFAFFLVVALIKNTLKFKLIYFVLSLIHFANLYFVYFYYNFVYSNSQYAFDPVYKFFESNYNYFTFINLAIFGLLIYFYYKFSYEHK